MLAPTRAPREHTPERIRLSPPPRPPDSGGWRRVRRIALLSAAICLLPAVASYAHMLTQPSNSSLGIRTVEWLRDNGARGLVNRVESIYYSLTAPAKGGPGLKALPGQVDVGLPPAQARVHHRIHYYRPRSISPVIHPGLPGEG